MIPDPNAPPLRQALAVLFNHPELLTLDPSRARPVQELIAGRQNPHFADVWQFISAHPLGSGDPWAEFVPIADVNGNEARDNDGKTLYQWALTPGMCSVIRQPLAAALQLVRTAPPIAPPGGGQRFESADTSWTIVDVPSRFGVMMPSVSFDSGKNTCALQVQNTYPRHVSVYVEFFAAGQPVAPPAWTSRLPPAAQDFLETGTVKYLTTLPPTCPVAGLPAPAVGTSLSFSLPEPATAARVMFGGTGLGDLNLLVDAGRGDAHGRAGPRRAADHGRGQGGPCPQRLVRRRARRRDGDSRDHGRRTLPLQGPPSHRYAHTAAIRGDQPGDVAPGWGTAEADRLDRRHHWA